MVRVIALGKTSGGMEDCRRSAVAVAGPFTSFAVTTHPGRSHRSRLSDCVGEPGPDPAADGSISCILGTGNIRGGKHQLITFTEREVTGMTVHQVLVLRPLRCSLPVPGNRPSS
jgi:hypothetical protein